jgi:hypothetical protein
VVEDRVRWNIAWYAFSAGWHAARRTEDDPPRKGVRTES